MTNRIGKLWPPAYPSDVDGIAGLPILGRDQFDPHVAALLVRLGDLWRDAAACLRTSMADTTPYKFQPALCTTWRAEVHRLERLAAREVLIERGLMFNDEEEPPECFDPIYLEYAPGQAVYVAPGFARFHPDEPALLNAAKPAAG